MEGNGAKYIRLLKEIYNVPEVAENKLWDNVARIDDALKDYFWEDVERQVSVFYAYKSDKTYPKIGQVLALLRADRNVERANMEESDYKISKPTTKIVLIRGVFHDACKWLHANGVLYSDYFDTVEKIPYGNKMRLKKTELPNGHVRYDLWNVRFDCDDVIRAARERYPDVFAQFEQYGEMRFTEQFALAVHLGFMKL